MKKEKSIRRQIFVLTVEEKKAVACVVGAILLGLGTQHYRSTHPRTAPALSPREQRAAQRTAKAAAARARSARGQAATRPTPRVADENGDDD
jgi:hypothetical protein